MGRKGESLVELTEKKKPTENSRLWGIGGVVATGFKPRLYCYCGNVRIKAEHCGIRMLLSEILLSLVVARDSRRQS